MSQISPPTAPEPVSPKTRASTWSKLFAMREAGTLAALILMLLVIAVAIPQFRQWENIVNITRNFSFVGMVAMGMAPAILTGLVAAAAVGLFNGLCITRLNMSPFVPTLASLSIARALALIITHGRPISKFGPQQTAFYWLGGGSIAGIPTPFILFVVMAIIFWVVT